MTYIAFTDYQKAFGKVHREQIWSILVRKGAPQYFTGAVENLCVDNKIITKTPNVTKDHKGEIISCRAWQSAHYQHLFLIYVRWDIMGMVNKP